LAEQPMAVSERWLSIRKAAALLGVNQATLRQWGDAGRIRTYTTPGGHRRFCETDLLALVDRGSTAVRPGLAEILLGSRERYEALVRRCLSENSWFQSFDEPARRHFRILGSSMLNLISAFLIGARRDRARTLLEGRDVAAEYGTEAARLGLSLPQATEAFLLFRTPVLEGLSRWVGDRQTDAREGDDILRRANYFMDQVLLSMAASHEAARLSSESGARA
jgi:excisionase family DNA binding protein